MLRIAVFGTGHLGKFHLNNWKEIDDIEIVGFYDPNNEQAAAIENQYNILILNHQQLNVQVMVYLHVIPLNQRMQSYLKKEIEFVNILEIKLHKPNVINDTMTNQKKVQIQNM